MKLWQVAAVLVVLGIAFILISRPTIQVGGNPYTSNSKNSYVSLASSLAGLATGVLNKIGGPPSQLNSSSTFVPDTSIKSDASYASEDLIGA